MHQDYIHIGELDDKLIEECSEDNLICEESTICILPIMYEDK